MEENINGQKEYKEGGKKSLISNIISTIIVLALIAFGAWFYIKNSSTPNINSENTDAAATVNGVKITKKRLDDLVNQQQASLSVLGGNTSPEEIKGIVLDSLISREILLQGVQKSGVTVTEEDVNKQIEKIKAQFPDDKTFEQALNDQNVTLEDLEASTKEQLLIEGYIASEVDLKSVDVTSAEVEEFYNQIGDGQELPPLEEIEVEIEGQIRQQKENELINAFIEKLKESADIQIN